MSAPEYQQYGVGQALQPAAAAGNLPPQMAASPIALEILDSIPSRAGTAILRASDGAIYHRPEGGESPVSDNDASVVYQMLREMGEVIPDGEGLKRLEISFQNDMRYTLVLVDDGLDGLVYIIKRRANE